MSFNRPYSTLHSPDEPQQFSLHTPIEGPGSRNLYSSPHNGDEPAPQSPVYDQSPLTFPPPPTSHMATERQQIQPMPAPGLSQPGQPAQPAVNAHFFPAPPTSIPYQVSSAHPSPPNTPGLPPIPGVETIAMTPQPARSPPPPFDHYPGLPQQPRSPPPAFDTHEPHPSAAHPQDPSQVGFVRPPMPPVPIQTPSYNPSDANTGPRTPKTPTYTPGAAAGPNGGVHAPGQIGHPNQRNGVQKYQHGMCDCMGDIPTCCLGYWCPCILYSRTYHRLKTAPKSNIERHHSCNIHCGIFCLLAPVSFVLTTLQRSRIRENYRIEGSVASDCVKAYCCSCCVLIQDDREVRHREDQRRQFEGPGSGVVGEGGYRRQPTMTYP
ncbi:PLAC8 family-domain-containing protein [Sphaerosporella brunnea]|uniref:PLAC8 family-domain-containing protein n=1 Tax=Sphaerosporella brunnea TaxID=1250544 RepID=A0A5J5F7W9_9PEZI|nr:PLAC8 family-domain-containing protein [Sphaerosporella brunnea]